MSLRALVFWFLLVFAMAASHVQAQLQVTLKIPRRLYMAYEPLIATISITNVTGHDVVLADEGAQKWFGFQISTADERLVPPRDVNYDLQPLTIQNGTTVKRSVNLVSLYPVTDFGLYHVRANVYFHELNRYFSSQPATIEVSEGRALWQQTVGVPEGAPGAGSYRSYELLSFRLPKDNMLYVRVQDQEAGIVYATYPVGRMIEGNTPQLQLDTHNQLHVLQLVGPKTYIYSRIGLNGEWGGQMTYNQVKSRPHLVRLASGKVDVSGGQLDVPVTQAPDASPAPKLSDRPAGLPER